LTNLYEMNSTYIIYL